MQPLQTRRQFLQLGSLTIASGAIAIVLHPPLAPTQFLDGTRHPGDSTHSYWQVVNGICQPISGAIVDFWHADHAGNYDNAGYKLRGHQFTDSQGRYRLETIVPGLYPGRVRHIHVSVQSANQSILTTQLFFPGEAGNASDGLFDPMLRVRMNSTQPKNQAGFTFALA